MHVIRFFTFVYLFKNEVSQWRCAEALAEGGVFTKIKEIILKYTSKRNVQLYIYSNFFNSFFRKLFGPVIQQIFDPISIILPQMDFLKDMILVVRLITLLGGIIVVFNNPQFFSSVVST